MANDFAQLFAQRERNRYATHARHLNEQMVRVLKAIGYDVGFCRGKGQYLYDREGTRYLDLLSGYGVFAIGRNHPVLREALYQRWPACLQSGFLRVSLISIKYSSQILARKRSKQPSNLLGQRPVEGASYIATTRFTVSPMGHCRSMAMRYSGTGLSLWFRTASASHS